MTCALCAGNHRDHNCPTLTRDLTAMLELADGRFVADIDHHGRASVYRNHACRCGPCTRAASEYQRQYKQRERVAA